MAQILLLASWLIFKKKKKCLCYIYFETLEFFPDHSGAWYSFFHLPATLDQPAWYTLWVAAWLKWDVGDSNLILVQPPGFSCWTDIILDQKEYILDVKWPLGLVHSSPSPPMVAHVCKVGIKWVFVNFIKIFLSLLYLTTLNKSSGYE